MPLMRQAGPLATTPPTTLAGVAAVLRFANEIEDAGNEWPDTDTVGRDGWHYQLRATMAAAIETLLKAQARKGGAVITIRLVGGTDVKPTIRIANPDAPRTAPRLVGLASNTTSTAENGRLRAQRCDIWRAAEAATQYWRLRLKFESAISYAQRMEIPEGRSHPGVDCKDHLSIVAWRQSWP
jgi:hypothetical protein